MDRQQSEEVLRQWSESAPYWEKNASTIHRMFAPISNRLIDQAEITAGQSVLDVAGGAGEPTFLIAETVGPTGTVTYTDAVQEMVQITQREAARRGFANIEFHRCPAESLPFPDDAFDATVSRLGLMFFPDPVGALQQMLRVTRPGGRVALAVWGEKDTNPFFTRVTETVSRYVESPPVEPDAPGAFRFAQPGAVGHLLAAAGWREIEEDAVDFSIQAPLDPEQFWRVRVEMSESLRGKMARLSTTQRMRLRAEIVEGFLEFFPDGQMSIPARVNLARAKKA